MSKCEPARFHSAGSKSFFIDSASKRAPRVHARFASEAQSCIERVMSSVMTSAPGGGSPWTANGGGFPSAHAWKRLFWFSFQYLSHSLPCCSNPFIDVRLVSRETLSNDCSRSLARQSESPLGGRGLSLKSYHLANGLAFVEQVEPTVDVLELEAAGHEAIHRQLAHAIEIDVARQGARRDAGADVAALDRALLRDEVRRRHGPRRTGRRQPGRDRGSSAARDAIGGLESSGRARHFDGIVHAALGGLLHLLDQVRIGGVEDMRRAQFLREGELLRGKIDGEPRARAGGDRAE